MSTASKPTTSAQILACEGAYRRGFHQAVCQVIANFKSGMTFDEADRLEDDVQAWREEPTFRQFFVQPPPTWHRD